jgi:hypothetical protein
MIPEPLLDIRFLIVALLGVPLVALWVSAWLFWTFHGELRQFLFCYVFPKSWRVGRDKFDIMTLSRTKFEMFLGAESEAPGFVRGVLGCPGCLSAYVSASGTVLFAAAFLPISWCTLIIIPLVWAPSAYAGHRIHSYL